MSNQDNQDIDFSEKFSELEEITKYFKEDEYDIETGIEKFEQGLEIASKLKEKLNQAENRVEKIKEDFEEEN
ncbi:MAG: exodeoxyribonuclease VII small subunit [Parcubacteria group bacterium QH_9_35_7]|nr:MAG: exodeoxyribonuclease VII small subunit [Parcubacteria group bacterium QH_9_35_7]